MLKSIATPRTFPEFLYEMNLEILYTKLIKWTPLKGPQGQSKQHNPCSNCVSDAATCPHKHHKRAAYSNIRSMTMPVVCLCPSFFLKLGLQRFGLCLVVNGLLYPSQYLAANWNRIHLISWISSWQLWNQAEMPRTWKQQGKNGLNYAY